MLHTQFVGMLMIYLHTNFHNPSSNSSSNTAIKLKVKHILLHGCHVNCIPFYTKKELHIRHIFFKDLLPYVKSEPYIDWC